MVSQPRFALVPPGAVSSLGARAVELAAGAGLVLSADQQQVLHGGLGVKADGSWTGFEVVNVQPRQNGKSSTLQARILVGLERGEQIAYTSHRVDSAQEVFRAVVALVGASPELGPLVEKVSYANGKESIQLANGARVVFGTRSSRTGRGFSLDCVILDESHYLSEHAHSALLPATSARKKAPQVWYAASAVDQLAHEHGLVLTRLRERGIADVGDRLAYYEWSVGLVDDQGVELRPEQVTPEMVDDPELWALANPGIGAGRISVEHVRAEMESMSWRGFCTERLGIGSWPDTSNVADAPISGEEWSELYDPDSKVVGEIVLAFDITRDRHCALMVCGRRGVDDRLHIELLRSASGTSWLREQLEHLDARHDVREIVADDYGGNRAMIGALEDAGLQVRALTGSETVAACSKLIDLVAEGAFRHIGQGELRDALRGAKARPVGDAWAWSRKASAGNAAVVVAMTLALAAGSEIEVDQGDLVIY